MEPQLSGDKSGVLRQPCRSRGSNQFCLAPQGGGLAGEKGRQGFQSLVAGLR